MALIVDELYKTKSPKVIILQVDERPTLIGHLALKIIAPEKWIAFPPRRCFTITFTISLPYPLAR